MKQSVSATIVSAICTLALCNSAFANPSNRASQILTPELAQKVLGSAVKPGPKNEAADTVKGKTWVSKAKFFAKTESPTSPMVNLLIRHAESVEQAKEIFKTNKASGKGTDVANLGDGAYRTKTPGQLNVLKGQNWVIIMVGTPTSPDTAGQEKIAKEILPKITF